LANLFFAMALDAQFAGGDKFVLGRDFGVDMAKNRA
jgi:hypothetical protein